jgi:hypothetical protein
VFVSDAEFCQKSSRQSSTFASEAEEQMFTPDVDAAETLCLLPSELERLFQARRNRHDFRRGLLPAANERFDSEAGVPEIGTHRGEDSSGKTVLSPEQA